LQQLLKFENITSTLDLQPLTIDYKLKQLLVLSCLQMNI